MFSYAGRGKMTDWFDELKAEAEIPLNPPLRKGDDFELIPSTSPL